MKDGRFTKRTIERIRRRRVKGLETYGIQLEDTPLDITWLDELADELADALIYLEKVKEVINETHRSKMDR